MKYFNKLNDISTVEHTEKRVDLMMTSIEQVMIEFNVTRYKQLYDDVTVRGKMKGERLIFLQNK